MRIVVNEAVTKLASKPILAGEGYSTLKDAVLVLFLSYIITNQAKAEYWSGVGETKHADMAMQDMALPYFAETTYNAFWHSWFRSKTNPKKGMFFYGGNTFNNQGKADYASKTYLQWSFWGHGNQVDPVYGLPGFKLTNEVGEGANAKTAGFYTLKEKRWYRHLVRFWSPSDKEEAKTHSYIGWWMKDLEGAKEWTLLAVSRVALAEARFTGTGLGGFIEDFGNGGRKSRGQSYRNLYTHADGKWESCKLKTSAKKNEYQKVTLSSDETSVDFEVSSKPFPEATIKTEDETVALKQKPKPVFGKIGINKARTMQIGNEILVSWQLKKGSTPQLRSKIEVFNSTAKNGNVLFTHYSDLPSESEAFIHIPSNYKGKAHCVKITITDIFNQTVTKTVVIRKKANVKFSPMVLKSPKSGVKIAYYEKQDAIKHIPREDRSFANWSTQPDLAKLSLSRTVYQKNLNLNVIPRKYGVAAKATSFLKITKPGLYRFHLRATDGGFLKIKGKLLIEQNIYGSAEPKTSWLLLSQGYYPIEITAYVDTTEDSKNEPALTLEYEGPGIQRRQVPSTAWFLKGNDCATPQVNFITKAGKGSKSNLVMLRVDNNNELSKGLKKVEIISQSGEIWATFEAKDSKQQIILMPEGDHQLNPRLHYKNKDVYDLAPKKVMVKNGPSYGWKLCSEGNRLPQRPLGYLVEDKCIILMGDGTRWMTKEIKGDFEFSMRVKNLQNAIGKNLHTSKVTFGFFASESLKRPESKTFNWMYDPYFKARFETPTRSFHGLKQKHWKSSFHDFSIGSYFSFSRKANKFVGRVKTTTKDKWKVIFEEEVVLTKALHIGPYLLQTPTPNREMFYRVEFDEIKIKEN